MAVRTRNLPLMRGPISEVYVVGYGSREGLEIRKPIKPQKALVYCILKGNNFLGNGNLRLLVTSTLVQRFLLWGFVGLVTAVTRRKTPPEKLLDQGR